MRHRHSRFTVIAFFFLVGCGGGGGGSSNSFTTATPTSTTHAIQLGPIAGAAVTVYRSDCKSLLYQTTTDQDGNYKVDVGRLQAAIGNPVPELLCVEAVGGKDVDPNDEGTRTAGEEVPMQGAIRGFVKTADIMGTSGTKINLFGAAIADILGASSDVTIARVEQIAEQLGVPDVDKDGKITLADITQYQMGSGSNGEASLRDFYLKALHENDVTTRQAFVDNAMITLSGVREEVKILEGGEARLVLTAFSATSTIRYGLSPARTLPSVCTGPLPISPNQIFFMQECSSTGCLPSQSIQIASNGKKIREYSDSGGIDLSEQVANQSKRAELASQIEQGKAQVVKLSADLATQNSALQTLQSDISQIASDSRLLDTEITRLQNP